jgi:hypothetical protein
LRLADGPELPRQRACALYRDEYPSKRAASRA